MSIGSCIQTACVATQDAQAVIAGAPGFWARPVAWLHLPARLDRLAVRRPVAIYAVPNNGGWYDFGYFLGIVVFGVGARKTTTVYRDRAIDARARRIN